MNKIWKILGLIAVLLVVLSGFAGVASAKPSAKLTPNNWDITVNQGDAFTVILLLQRIRAVHPTIKAGLT